MRLTLALLACVVLGCGSSEEPGEWRATGDGGRTVFHSRTGEIRRVRDAENNVIEYRPEKK